MLLMKFLHFHFSRNKLRTLSAHVHLSAPVVRLLRVHSTKQLRQSCTHSSIRFNVRTLETPLRAHLSQAERLAPAVLAHERRTLLP